MSLVHCRECGREISDKADVCPNCGYSFNKTHQPTNKVYVDNHLAKSILVTLFCCLPLGIVAIVNSASVNGKLQAGDISGARRASESADKYCNWSMIGGAIAGALWFFIVIAASN